MSWGLGPGSGLQLAGCPGRDQPALHLLMRLIKKELRGGGEQGEVCRVLGEGCPAVRRGALGRRLPRTPRGPEPWPLPDAAGRHRPSLCPAPGCREERREGFQGPPPESVAGKTWGGGRDTFEGEVKNSEKSLPVRGCAACLGIFPLCWALGCGATGLWKSCVPLSL